MEEKKRILKLVEEGKLSADEALSLLEALGSAAEGKQIKTELSTQVNYENEKTNHQSSYKESSTKTKIFDFLDSAIKKIKDLDLDFNFGNSIEVNHIFHHQDVFLKDLDIDVANGSVKLIPWNEQDVRIECQAKVYKVENQTDARQSFLQDVLFSIEAGKLRFSAQKKQMKVNAIVYIPKNSYDFMKIRMFNGPISCEKLDVINFKAKTANGKITVTGIFSNQAEIETANGHINVINGQIDDLEVETINGSIQVGGSYEKLNVQSFHGHVDCRLNDNRCKTALIKTTSGNVDVHLPAYLNIDGEFKSNLGAFSCEFEGMTVLEEKKEVVQKLLRFKVDQQAVNQMNLYIDSKTGSIKLKQIRSEKHS